MDAKLMRRDDGSDGGRVRPPVYNGSQPPNPRENEAMLAIIAQNSERGSRNAENSDTAATTNSAIEAAAIAGNSVAEAPTETPILKADC